MKLDGDNPRAAVRGVFLAVVVMASVGFILAWMAEGHIDGQMAAFLGVLWMFWVIAGDVRRVIVEPVARLIRSQAVGGVADGVPMITPEEEIAYLERMTADPAAPRHRLIIGGIRLAELYRTCRHDQAKSDATLAALGARFPDSPELKIARGPVPSDGLPLPGIDDITRSLEGVVADTSNDAHHRIMAGLRLAEIFRTHQHDAAKAAALLTRLKAEFPDQPPFGGGLDA